MRKLLIAACLMTAGLLGQDKPAVETYRVDFQIREDNAKVRRYTILSDNNGSGGFRVGTKVAYPTALSPAGVATSYSYMDIGVSIGVRVRPAQGGKVALVANVEISGVQAQEKSSPNPTLSSVKTDVSTQLTPKKPYLIASIEDPSTARKFDVEVTVTPVE